MKNAKTLIPINELHQTATQTYLNQEFFDWNKLNRIPYFKKIQNERKWKVMTDEFIEKIRPIHKKWSKNLEELSKDSGGHQVKQELRVFLEKIDVSQILFDQPFLSFFVEKGYLDVAEQFILGAQKAEPTLENHELFQALRNVWIMNSLQLYWHRPLALTPSVYSYSLLYPYTDNYLDNQEVSPLDKIQFNHKLEQALAGEQQLSDSSAEKRIYELIEQIEIQYNRLKFPQVYKSLEFIHDAQVKSLQQGHLDVLTNEKLLNLSFYKGGTSVLADGFLIKPDLRIEQMQFSYHYGAFLQLLDDLQDIEEDQQTNHQTLYSTEKFTYDVDIKIERLIAYIYAVNEIHPYDTAVQKTMKEVIRTCTLMMVMEAVGSNPEIVSPSFYSKLESYSKVRLSFFSEYKKSINAYFNGI